MRVLEHGLEGSAMLSYGITSKERSAVIHYIKTFAPVWFDPNSKVQDPYVPTEDPYQDDVMAGIQRGEQVYHVEAACWSCHPSYLSESEIQGYRAAEGLGPTAFRENFRLPAALPIIPPDYRWDGVKISSSPEGVYRTLLRGLAGSGMPAYEDILDDKDIWAVAHYVSALVEEGKENRLASSSMPSKPFGEPPEYQEPDSTDASAESAAVAPPATMARYGCLGCHAVDSPRAAAGPSLYDIGSRQTPEEIYASIKEPDAIMAEGFEYATGIMSGTLNANGFYDNVSDEEFDELVSYLVGLKGE
jgi:mono/diheme cytochrome c family protein